MEKETQLELEEMFRQRMINLKIKFKSVMFYRLQAEFFAGIVALLSIQKLEYPPIWYINVQTRRENCKPYELPKYQIQ